MEDHLLRVRDSLRSRMPYLEGVLQIIVVQSLGRMIMAGLPNRLRSEGSYVVITSLQDLSILARKEVGDPLALWKFAKASERLRSGKTKLMHFGGLLDSYALYKGHGDSFYLSDEAKPTFVSLMPDVAAKLRHEDAAQFDFHGAASWDGERFFTVQRLHAGSNIPIYARDPSSFDRVELLVEGLPIPAWVFHHSTHSLSSLPYFEICQAIAYWLWQVTPSISALVSRAALQTERISISVYLEPSESWIFPVDTSEANWIGECETKGELIGLKLTGGAARALSGADNSGERQILTTLLIALQRRVQELTGEQSDLDIEAIVDRHAPLGIKKMILLLHGSANIELLRGSLPPARLLQEADVEEVLDYAGPQVSSALGLTVGPILPERRVEALNGFVKVLFSRLEASVSRLSSEGLLDFLMAQHESLTRSSAEHRLSIPTRLACFGSEASYVEMIKKRSQALVDTNLANRFLIEYVAALPPQGEKRISVDQFDQLMAMASEIIHKGMLSDALNYGLADVDLNILPSGRLGVAREGRFVIGTEKFRHVKVLEDIVSAQSRFGQFWPDLREDEDSPDTGDLDSAMSAEFGITMTDLMRLFAELEGLASDSDREPAQMPLDEATTSLAQSLGIERQLVLATLELFALKSRRQFILKDQAPEIYPWRFGRDLSYVRRPFVIRKANGVEQILWGKRHLEVCRKNLFSLIYSGRLKAQSANMKKFMSRMKNQETEAFNDLVAEVFEENGGLIVRKRVEKIGAQRIEDRKGWSLGDIDVLAVDPKKRKIWAVETKDFEVARTPFELSSEVKKLFSGQDSAASHHEKRVLWLERHLTDICAWLNLPLNRGRWRVEALIIVSSVLMTPYIYESSFRVMSLEELKRNGIPG